jgi:hypothetical protein
MSPVEDQGMAMLLLHYRARSSCIHSQDIVVYLLQFDRADFLTLDSLEEAAFAKVCGKMSEWDRRIKWGESTARLCRILLRYPVPHQMLLQSACISKALVAVAR